MPHPHRMNNPRSGFTLIEISVVLVILALLTGGIMIGQTMIRSSEIRKLIKEHDEIASAVRLFRERYSALPGDMATATRYWGALDAVPANCITKSAEGTKTCNGDGNGLIEGGTSNERFRFWQHLANAELIEGHYTGRAVSGGAEYHVPGVNTPKSRLDSGGWSLNYSASAVATASMWSNTIGYYTRMCLPVTNSDLGMPALVPDEMWSMDAKIDDGVPGQGNLRSGEWQNCSTATARTDFATAEYKLTEKLRRCCPMFMDIVP